MSRLTLPCCALRDSLLPVRELATKAATAAAAKSDAAQKHVVSVSTLRAVQTTATHFVIQRTESRASVAVSKVPRARACHRTADYAALQAALKARKAARYYDGVDG